MNKRLLFVVSVILVASFAAGLSIVQFGPAFARAGNHSGIQVDIHISLAQPESTLTPRPTPRVVTSTPVIIVVPYSSPTPWPTYTETPFIQPTPWPTYTPFVTRQPPAVAGATLSVFSGDRPPRLPANIDEWLQGQLQSGELERPCTGNQVDCLIERGEMPKLGTPPQEIILDDSLTSEEKRIEQDGLQLLKTCAPFLYDYVTQNVTRIERGNVLNSSEAIAYTLPDRYNIYLPAGTILGDNEYQDSARTFVAAASLVHEATHIVQGADSERVAYQQELEVYTPACYPNDIDPAILENMRRDVEARTK